VAVSGLFAYYPSCGGVFVALCENFPLNTFSAAGGDFAKAAAIFLPLIPTKLKKEKWTLIYKNFSLFLTTPHKPE
jgi:hypothetical protein